MDFPLLTTAGGYPLIPMRASSWPVTSSSTHRQTLIPLLLCHDHWEPSPRARKHERVVLFDFWERRGWCKEGVWPLIPVAAISKKQELFYTLFWDGHSDLATRQRRGSGKNKVSFIHRSWRQEAHRATWINPSVVKRQKAGLKRKLRLRHLLRLPQQRQSREGWAVQFQPVSLMREIDS